MGVDLSPVATLAGRLLADYPARNWSAEPAVPIKTDRAEATLGVEESTMSPARLPRDVEIVLAEVGRRVAERMALYYPKNIDDRFPWGYLWAVTMPCDQCRRRFPLLGSLVFALPYIRRNDKANVCASR